MIPLSRIEEILDSYDKGVSYDKKPQSRVEALLLNLLFGTTYVVPFPISRIERQLSELELYSGDKLSRIEEILDCKIRGTEYTGNLLSRIEGEEYEMVIGTFEFIAIDDNTGDPILDNNGDEILSKVRVAA